MPAEDTPASTEIPLAVTDGKQSWYPFDDGASPAPTDAEGTPLEADD